MSIKRLSVTDMQRVAGVSFKQNRTISWHGNNLVIRQFLPLCEYLQMINSIVNDCCNPEGAIAIEIIDFAIRTNVISNYALVELPDDSAALFEVIYATDLYDTVCKYANKAQIESAHQIVYEIARGK